MKKYTEILEEIKKANAAITDTAKAEKEFERVALLETRKNGSEEDFQKARAEYEAAAEKYKKECENNETQQMKIEILKDNAARALFAENIGIICDVWNKYEGKPHGEKTSKKIIGELSAATGHRVYIGNKWDEAHISIYPGSGGYGDEITIAPVWDGEKQPALNSSNKIMKLNPENMRVCYCGEYVENVEEHANAIKAAHADALKALEEYRAAIDKYNDLTRGSMQRASDREGVKHYII